MIVTKNMQNKNQSVKMAERRNITLNTTNYLKQRVLDYNTQHTMVPYIVGIIQ